MLINAEFTMQSTNRSVSVRNHCARGNQGRRIGTPLETVEPANSRVEKGIHFQKRREEHNE